MGGITESIGKFTKDLTNNRDNIQEKIATLKLMGSLEDFLVKEVSYYIVRHNRDKYFIYLNLGGNNRRIDICLLKKAKDGDNYEICGFIEAKYLSNGSRDEQNVSKGETDGRLMELSQQLGRRRKGCTKRYGKLNVGLLSKKRYVYGLIFATFVSTEKNDAKKEKFFGAIRGTAKKDCNLKHHDLPDPTLTPIFDAYSIKTLLGMRYVSFRIGLWVLKNKITCN